MTGLGMGHALAVGVAVAVAVAIGTVIPITQLRWVVAATLMCFGLLRLIRHRHPRWTGMRVGMGGLTPWSFLMASAHATHHSGEDRNPYCVAHRRSCRLCGAAIVGGRQSRHQQISDLDASHDPDSYDEVRAKGACTTQSICCVMTDIFTPRGAPKKHEAYPVPGSSAPLGTNSARTNAMRSFKDRRALLWL